MIMNKSVSRVRESMKAKVVPISLIIVLVLFHIFSDSNQMMSSITFIHGIGTLVYLCVWGLFLWYSVKVMSKGLLVLYHAFWLLSIISIPLGYFFKLSK